MQKSGSGQILFIEDEATSREISLLILEGAGYEVEAANCAETAHQRLSSSTYRLLIADWLLPDGDGIYLADRAARLGIATLIVTGHIADLPPGTGSRHHLLTKPFSPTGLLAAVRAIIGEPRRYR
jgi:two-component system, NtrC family, response regulator HydG